MEWKWRIETNAMKQTKRMLKGLACSAAIGLALATGSAKATDYEIIKLAPEDPNCNYSYASSINSGGVVVGVYGEKAPRNFTLWEKPFLYRDGIFRSINIELDNYPYDVINDFGEILGRSPDPNLSYYSGIYKIDGSVILDFWGSDINNKGEVCGEFQGNSGRLYRDGETIQLPLMHVHAINDHSQVVGEIAPSVSGLWEEGEVTQLETPLGGGTRAYDINNKGQIVGQWIYGPEGGGCLWENGIMIKLGASDAFGINDHGTIVGGDAAYIYEKGEVKYLEEFLPENSKWKELSRALDINNDGQIVGYGDYQEDGETYTYDFAFLMNPIENTSTLTADSNNDGIVNGFDLAELANQWLEREEWYGE